MIHQTAVPAIPTGTDAAPVSPNQYYDEMAAALRAAGTPVPPFPSVIHRFDIAAAEAEAGVLYLLDEGKLNPAAAMTAAGAEIHEGLPSLDEAQGAGLIHSALRDGTPVIGQLESDDVHTLGLTGVPDIAQLSHAVAVPLLNRTRQRVGCLLLLGVDAFDTAHVAFIKALSGSAASSLETRELIKSQKALFEAFIQLIAGAIDSKSPYTGGHCERVPELTKMLADAACEQAEGPFADFRLSEDETGKPCT